MKKDKPKIEEQAIALSPPVMLSLPDFDERNDVMHEICETGQKAGGMIIIDEAAIRLLWTYDKWLQKRIGLKGNGA